jgi:hypothetical protein
VRFFGDGRFCRLILKVEHKKVLSYGGFIPCSKISDYGDSVQ